MPSSPGAYLKWTSACVVICDISLDISDLSLDTKSIGLPGQGTGSFLGCSNIIQNHSLLLFCKISKSTVTLFPIWVSCVKGAQKTLTRHPVYTHADKQQARAHSLALRLRSTATSRLLAFLTQPKRMLWETSFYLYQLYQLASQRRDLFTFHIKPQWCRHYSLCTFSKPLIIRFRAGG